ncbi:MAG: BCCT family transporter [Pseudomonadota bacterium]
MIIRPEILSKRVIGRVGNGIYKGFNRPVALGSMALVVAMITWIIVSPDSATEVLSVGKQMTLTVFRAWYVYALAGFVAFCFVIVLLPVSARIRLGGNDSMPDYSTGSWLSMMFCAGIGAGVLIYSVSEPLAHLASNPQSLLGELSATDAHAGRIALSYTYLHWGLSSWSCYAVLGLAIALYSYRYGMPLTVRTALAPLLGREFGRSAGNLIDVFSIFAIIVGVATTLGYGVAQFVSGAHAVTGFNTLVESDNSPRLMWQLVALVFAAAVATGSVVLGVARGIKWLSNLSTFLFFAVLFTFFILGDTGAVARLGEALWEYVAQFPQMATMVASEGGPVAQWQTDWTIFYWTWWIAFAPFVALFLARVSRGRTLREFILGCVFMPVCICTVWFAFVGGAAIDVQLNPALGVDLYQTPISGQIYQTFYTLAGPAVGTVGNLLIALLLLLLLITTLNAAILAINTIAAAGDETCRVPFHVVTWGVSITLIIGSLVAAGGTDSVRDAMILGALPFSFVIALSAISTIVALAYEAAKAKMRSGQGASEQLHQQSGGRAVDRSLVNQTQKN